MLLDAGCVLCAGPSGPICGGCAERLVPAPHAAAGDPPLTSLISYEGVGRELVTTLKYRNGRCLVAPVASLLALLVDPRVELVTWVPASRAGRQERGFDQGRLLARAVAHRTGLPARGLLRRAAGPPQTRLSRADRQTGPSLDARRRGSSRVVIVDDVVTTGSTLRVATEALAAVGWVPVQAMTVAATPRRDPSRFGRARASTVGPLHEPMVDADH